MNKHKESMSLTEYFKKLKETNPKYRNLKLTDGGITDNFMRQINEFVYGKISEGDMVVLKENVDNIPKGSTGTVVHIHGNGEAIELEFELEGMANRVIILPWKKITTIMNDTIE